MKTIYVAAAAIILDNKVLVTKRGHGEFAGFWEFPGGKLEEGESSDVAIIREIREELKADIVTDRFLIKTINTYSSFILNMDTYICRLVSANIHLVEHLEARFVDFSELKTLKFPPADQEVADALVNLFLVK